MYCALKAVINRFEKYTFNTCSSHNFRVVKELILHNKRSGVENKSGKLTPMHLACENGHLKVVETIATMVKQWVNSSDGDNDLKTPLYIASEKGYVKIVNTLVKHNAKLCPTRYGTTPIHVAVQKGNIELVRILLSAYPDDVNTADKKRQTPLHHAALHCEHHPEIITALVQR